MTRESSLSRGVPPPAGTTRILTVPNLLSLLRLAGVPLFLWLLLGPRADGWALVVLMVGGFTDWLDGKLARLLNQYSALGALLDPAVDRLYILAALVALGVRDVVPVVGRSPCSSPATCVLAACLPVLRARGYGPFRVSTWARARRSCCSTLSRCCCSAPATAPSPRSPARSGYAFAVWGTGLYLYSGLVYLGAVRAGAAPERGNGPPTGRGAVIGRVVGCRP